MQTVSLTEVGGLTTEVLARMGQGLAILTSDKVARAVALPYTANQQAAVEAAKRYIALANGSGSNIKVGRLKGTLQARLTNLGILAVLRRGVPAAILLPPPGNQSQAEQGAKSYLGALGIII